MKSLKNNNIFRFLGLTFIIAFNLFNNVKTAGISADDEIVLLRNMLKEEREANKARMEYYEKKLGKIAGITMITEKEEVLEKVPVKEKISFDAHQNLTKTLKKPFLNLLALTALTHPERLKKLVEEVEKALKEYKEKFIVKIKVEEKPEEITPPPAEMFISPAIPAPAPEEPKAVEIATKPTEEMPPPAISEIGPPPKEKMPPPMPTTEMMPPAEEEIPPPAMPPTPEITPTVIPETIAPSTPEITPTMPTEMPSPVIPTTEMMPPSEEEMPPPPISG